MARQFALDFTNSPSRTKQSFRDECDINRIVPNFQAKGTVPPMANGKPSYGDFTNATDYQEAMNQVIAADRSFYELPAAIRSRMQNSPAFLLDFLADPANQEEAVTLGLADAPPKPPRVPPANIPDPEEDPPPSPIEGGE